jgi:hypothetical protein
MEKKISLTYRCVKLCYMRCPNCLENEEKTENCQNCFRLRATNKQHVFKILETKTPMDFSFGDHDTADLPTTEDFNSAERYVFDKYTLSWFVRLGGSRKLLLLAKEVGMVKYANHWLSDFGAQALEEQMPIAADEYLYWLMGELGLEPDLRSLSSYMERKDVLFMQKMKMLETAFPVAIKRNVDRNHFISVCFNWSSDIIEVKLFYSWCLTNGCQVSLHDLITSFWNWGIQLFDFIQQSPGYTRKYDNLHCILMASRSTQEKMEAILYIFGNAQFQLLDHEFERLILKGEVEFLKFIIPRIFFKLNQIWVMIEKLALKSYYSHEEIDLSLETSLEILKLLFQKIGFLITDNSTFAKREDYRFGEIYDWLVNEKAMQAYWLCQEQKNMLEVLIDEVDEEPERKPPVTKFMNVLYDSDSDDGY